MIGDDEGKGMLACLLYLLSLLTLPSAAISMVIPDHLHSNPHYTTSIHKGFKLLTVLLPL
jgi:hypothetical protein